MVSERDFLGYAFLVGVGEYKDPRLNVPSVAQEVIRLQKVLVRRGYDEENIRLLTDFISEDRTKNPFRRANKGKLTSKAHILNELKDFRKELDEVAQTKGEFTVFIYLAGHGLSQDGCYYFLTSDTEFINETEVVLKSCISDKILLTLFLGIPAQHLVIFLNTCFSGSVGDEKTFLNISGLTTPLEKKQVEHALEKVDPQSSAGNPNAWAIITAAKDKSWLRRGENTSVFGKHLLVVLEGEDVEVTDVFSKLKSEIREEVIYDSQANKDVNQEPNIVASRKLDFPFLFTEVRLSLSSFEWLFNLCKKSISDYEQELFNTNPDALISRNLEKTLEDNFLDPFIAFFILYGDSGSGKSSIAYRALKKQLKQNNFCFWVDSELVLASFSWEDLLNGYFPKIYSNIQPDAGKAALKILREHRNKRLFIVVDDINRSTNPPKVLNKIVNWTAQQKNYKKEDTEKTLINREPSEEYFQIIVLCPIWTENLFLIDRYKHKKWFKLLSVGLFTPEEGKSAIKSFLTNIEVSEIQTEVLARELGYDPFLIGLFCDQILEQQQSLDHPNFDQIIESYTNGCIREIKGSDRLLEDYINTLRVLTFKMLQHRQHKPSLGQIRSWFEEDDSGEQIALLKELINQNKLCKLTNADNLLQFRHDRIIEHFMIQNVLSILQSGDLDNEILFEPFYAKIVSKALILAPQEPSFLETLSKKSPIVLIEALRYLERVPEKIKNEIINHIISWAEANYSGIKESNPYIQDVIFAAGWVLTEIDSPVILDITEYLSSHSRSLITLARFRNGCIDSGIRYCTPHRDHPLDHSHSLRDQIIEHSKIRHRNYFVKELSKRLKTPTSEMMILQGTLILTGFLALKELGKDLLKCWNSVEDKNSILAEILWAMLRCCDDNPEIMSPVMEYYQTVLSSGVELSKISNPIKILQFAIRKIYDKSIISYLIDQANQHENLKGAIIFFLSRIDSPDAIEFVVKDGADLQKTLEGTDTYSPWLLRLGDEWDLRSPFGRKLSVSSMQRLRSLWEGKEHNKHLRDLSFYVWLKSADWNDLENLRNIPLSSSLGERALWKRVELRDVTSIPDFIKLLRKDFYALNIAHNIWCDSIKLTVKELIEFNKDNLSQEEMDYVLSNLLFRIPQNDVEEILIKYWNYIGMNPLMIQVALYTGTEKCLELARGSIKSHKDKRFVFKHITSHFGCYMYGREEYLTEDKLNNLIPYLKFIDPFNLFEFGDHCHRMGISHWSEKNLYEILEPEWRKRLHPTDEELLNELIDITKEEDNKLGRIYVWVLMFEERRDTKERMIKILSKLLGYPNIDILEAIRLTSTCLRHQGTRQDLAILERDFPKSLSNKIEPIKEAIKFVIYRRTLE